MDTTDKIKGMITLIEKNDEIFYDALNSLAEAVKRSFVKTSFPRRVEKRLKNLTVNFSFRY